MTSVAQALTSARSAGLARLDADLLLLFAMGVDPAVLNSRRGWLLAHDTDPLPAAVLDRFRDASERRQHGEPLAYITGHKEFFGLDLLVDRRALIPRPDTEVLVEWALEVLDPAGPEAQPLRLLDLGTGSGAIALALKHRRGDLTVDAVDASPAALKLAQANATRLGLAIGFLNGSWFEPVQGHYHCIVSNPPYVEQDDPHLAALRHEPALALESGHDGLRDIRHIVSGASRHLMPDGWLLLEHGFNQGASVRAFLLAAGFGAVNARTDLAGHWRCTGGQWPGQDLGQKRLLSTAGPGK